MHRHRRNKEFRLISFWVATESVGDTEEKAYDWGETACEARIKLSLFNGAADIEEYRVAEGDGPVNALDNALRKCLLPHFPFLEPVVLTDYKVRIVDKKEGTAASVVVRIVFHANGRQWVVEETSTNVVNASLHALVDGYRKALYAFSGETSRLVGEITADAAV